MFALDAANRASSSSSCASHDWLWMPPAGAQAVCGALQGASHTTFHHNRLLPLAQPPARLSVALAGEPADAQACLGAPPPGSTADASLKYLLLLREHDSPALDTGLDSGACAVAGWASVATHQG